MEKATRQQTKEHNRNLVLKTIFEHASISRAEIARITSLTRTTVSDIVADLMAEGLVDEVGVGSSIGGKSPILLSLVADARYLIGLDLAHNQFTGAIINLRGKVKEMASLPVDNRNGEAALALVFEILDTLMAAQRQPLVGISVGTPGLVNTREGVVVNAVNLEWKDLPLAQLLQERYSLPVYVLNDSQAAAMGEYTYGDGHQSGESLVVINVRHGVGAGIVIGGQLFQGDGGGAGEIGHVVVVPENGLPCRCGNSGCLETVASAQAVVARAQALAGRVPGSVLKTPGDITFDVLQQAFTSGDPLARQVVLDAARYLGVAVSGLASALNIQKVLLSGDMARFGQLWLDTIRDTMLHTSLARLAQETHVEIGQLRDNRIILGACALMLSDYAMLFKA